MQLTSIILLLSAITISVSAFPGAASIIHRRQEAEANSTITSTPKDATYACVHSTKIVAQQLATMSKLKAQNITIPSYLSGYYTAINSGIEEVGCPALSLGKRGFAPNKQPCDVINTEHERMMALVNRFVADGISVAPFIAGFLSATLDGHKALSCPPFTGSATEAATAAAAVAAVSNSTSLAGNDALLTNAGDGK